MKMRGYSVLFVCALCVFVLCAAAAAVVVAQDEAPEKKAARVERGKADTAKQKGESALEFYTLFKNYVNSVADDLTRAIERIGASSTTADTLSLPGQVPSTENIKEDIGRLERAATEARNAVLALGAEDVDILSNQSKTAKFIKKMTDVESKMTEVEAAVVAVTDEISTIDAAIEKAGELQTAAEKAMLLWDATEGKLREQLVKASAAIAAINATKNDIEEARKKFADNTSPQTPDLNERLTRVVTDTLTPSLNTLTLLKNVLQNAKDAAEEAKNQNTALAARAKELKEKVEERKQKAADVKTSEAAKAMADTAKAKGDEALGLHEGFASGVSSVMSSFTLAVEKITASKIPAGKIKRTEEQKKKQILLEIDGLKTKAEAAKAAVEALRDAEDETLKDEPTRTALKNKMREEDELYMAVMEKAAAAVTGNISAIDAVIQKTGALEKAARKAGGLWYDASRDLDRQSFKARAAVSAVDTTITATEGFLNFFNGSSDPEAQKVNKELSDAVRSILKPSLERLISLRDALEKTADSALYTSDQYDELEEKAGMLKEAAKLWKLRTANVEAVEAAKAMADTAKAEGDEAFPIDKEFGSGVSSVVSSLTLAIRKITASKAPAGKIVQEIKDLKKEQILREIDELKTKAEAAVEALRDVEAWTLKNEQTKTALKGRMKEVELYMMEVEKAAAAVTGNISAIDAVIQRAGALEIASREAWYMWHDAAIDLDARLSSAMVAVSAVDTTITATEGFLNFFNGSSDPEAQKVKEELSDAVTSILKPSLERLISLRYASQKAKMAAREATGEYRALAVKARMLKETAEDWKLRAANVKAVEAAKDYAETAKAEGDEAFPIDKEFGSGVSSVVSSLTLAVEKITASKIPAGKIMQEIKDLKKERILREIDGLKTKAKAAVEALRDVEAWTLKNEQTKTALKGRMKEVELYMMEVEKAEAAVTGNISAIDAVIQRAGALEIASREASGLWRSAVWDLMIQLDNVMAAVSATITLKGEMESAVTKLGSNEDTEAQKVNEELSDIIENTLTPSLEKLMTLRDALEKAAGAAREARGEYSALAKKAKKLKEAAKDRGQNVQKVLQEGGQVSPGPPLSAAN